MSTDGNGRRSRNLGQPVRKSPDLENERTFRYRTFDTNQRLASPQWR